MVNFSFPEGVSWTRQETNRNRVGEKTRPGALWFMPLKTTIGNGDNVLAHKLHFGY